MTDPPDLTFYKEYPKSCDPKDFWGQVRRTVNGKPVPQEQVDMIIRAVLNALELSKTDVLLDLCCGNGALTTSFFEQCNGGVGVDFSEYLINIAWKHFLKCANEKYILQDVLEFVQNYPYPERFNKALCYGSIQYLPKDTTHELLITMRKRFTNLGILFIGNIPDKQFARGFFGNRYKPGVEDSPANAIGIWWTQEEFHILAKRSGWAMDVHFMPKDFYWSNYRYDVILTPV